MAVLEVADPTAFDPEEFDAYLQSRRDLGTKWTPRYVRLLSRLPLTATNKVDKTWLRRERWDGDGRVLWRPDRKGPLRPLTEADRAALADAIGHRGRVT
jgi:fatty-acyl-CoA synthase